MTDEKIMLPKPYPRDPESISREVQATLKIKDIQNYYRLKERLATKWWEFLVMTLLFVAGLGFIVTTLYLLPPKNLQIYFRFLMFWAVMLVLALIGTLEILITKIRTLHQLMNYQQRLITDLQNYLKHHGEDKGSATEDA
ncbi:MAG: hypothetical protein N2246_03450 [Candidatus Sumerlaeia bacterium]|nr:hypothetical protein [Candidatus Sumerlaeia bacterium]